MPIVSMPRTESTSFRLFSVGCISRLIIAIPMPARKPRAPSSTARFGPSREMPICVAMASLMTTSVPSCSALGITRFPALTMEFQMATPSSGLRQIRLISMICVSPYWERDRLAEISDGLTPMSFSSSITMPITLRLFSTYRMAGTISSASMKSALVAEVPLPVKKPISFLALTAKEPLIL